jgi:ubiquitin-protein ligase
MCITSTCIKRLVNDIKHLLKEPMENIYYKHDETNMLIGYLLIIGPNNTPYSCGYNFFTINYPENYPFLPPKITYICSDGETRYNPNLYICGKVCLSIINTWQGEGWTSCQTLHSLFLSIYSMVYTENPLTNEPGILINNKEVKKYNLLIEYKNIDFLILDILDKINDNDVMFNINFFRFKKIIIEKFIENYEKIVVNLNNLENKCSDINKIYIHTYNNNLIFDFNNLKKKLNNSYKKYSILLDNDLVIE